jgi:D-glycero-D-manno-heptose 1,7-bisphosphate phosphatase
MNRAAFLDRDGVINRKAPEGGYITRWEEVEILPGTSEAIAQLNRAAFRVIVVTNQRAVAKGLMTIAGLELIHRRMCEELALAGARIDAVFYCPHELKPPCRCRKPEPGMLLDAARRHDIDLPSSWMIGDSAKDVEAGRRAGCRTVRLTTSEARTDDGADIVAPTLLASVPKILNFVSGDAAKDQCKLAGSPSIK